MSALAGIVTSSDGLDPRDIAAMADALSIYGSNRVAIGRLPGAHFATCLRHATPEDIFDTQPLYHRETGLLLILDGRIDNREDLAELLAIPRADLAAMADSQLLFEFIQRKGIQSIAQVLGDYVLACYCARKRQLVVARDAMGARPLYWSHINNRLFFSSMPRGLLAVPGSKYDLSEQGLYDFLCMRQGGQAANLFQGMNVLPPGTLLQFSAGEVIIKPFFEFDCTFERSAPRAEAVVEQLSELMAQATRARLRTTGGVASQLSSGLDSPIVTAFAAKALSYQGKEIHAFTATPAPGQDLTLPRGWYADEGPGARAISSSLPSVAHHLINKSTGELSSVLAKEVELINAPVHYPCNVMWHAELRRQAIDKSCDLMLNGNCGNLTISYGGREILGALLGDLRLATWFSEVLACRAQSRWNSILGLSFAPHFPRAYMYARKRRRHYGPLFSEQFPISEDFAHKMAQYGSQWQFPEARLARNSNQSRRFRVDALLGWERAHYDMGDNAVGIDVRDPTADRRVVQYCLSLPLDVYFKAGKSRELGKKLLGKFVPNVSISDHARGYQGANWRHDICRDLPNIRGHFERFRSSELHHRYLAIDACLELLEQIDPKKPDKLPLDHQMRFFILRTLSTGLFLDAFFNRIWDKGNATNFKPATKIQKILHPPYT